MDSIALPHAEPAISSSANMITVGTRLDSSCAKQFARALARMADNQTPFVIIDMAHTKAVDSSGFGALIAGFRKLAEVGAGAVVVCSNANVRRLFDFAGVSRMITIVDRLSQARRLSPSTAQGALAS